MSFTRRIAPTLLLAGLIQFCPAASNADWRTGKSQQEARQIEDQRYHDVIAGLDKMHRNIYADYTADRIACGNDSRTNQGCLKAAADKRDRRLAANDQLRIQADALHANQLEDIYRFWGAAGAVTNGDVIASRGGGNPCSDLLSQQAALNGTAADWKSGRSPQEARRIEDQRYADVIAGLDKTHRIIYADYTADRIACGNDSRTNAACLQAAADKRDRRLAENDRLRIQANALHANQIQDIYRFWDKTGSPNRSGPCDGDVISSVGGGNPGDTPSGGDPSGIPGGGANSNGNRGGGNPSGNPRTPISDRPQPQLDGKAQTDCRDVPDNVWPPLAALQKFLDEMVAGYDVAKSPDAGLRIMRDSLLGLGFGWLLKEAPPVLAAAAGRAAPRLTVPIWRWAAPRVGGAVEPLMSSKLPPGMLLPGILKSTPRPLYLQEREASCGLACVKMMVETVKRTSYPESWYRTLARGAYGPHDLCAYTPGQGTAAARLADLLRQAGISSSLKNGQTIGDLMAATRNGYPALAAVGDVNAGHAVIVDGFAQDAAGNLFVLARDPWNLNLLDENARLSFQQMGFQNYAVYNVSDFTGPGGWNGLAIYTAP